MWLTGFTRLHINQYVYTHIATGAAQRGTPRVPIPLYPSCDCSNIIKDKKVKLLR